MIDDLLKRLLEFKFKEDNSIQSKCFKQIVKKNNTARLQKMKNIQSNLKLIKTGKEIGTTCSLGCTDCTHNFKPQEIKMTDKILRQKSNCIVCRSSKSRFLKQKRNNKKEFNVFLKLIL